MPGRRRNEQRHWQLGRAGRPRAVVATATLTGFLGVTALGGGVEMLLFPDGNQFVPGEWLDNVPVDSWTLPGLALGTVFGVGGAVTTYGLLRRPAWRPLRLTGRLSDRHWSWWMTPLLGIGLEGWIALEVALLPDRSWIELLYALIGLGMLVLPLTPSVRRYLTTPTRHAPTPMNAATSP